MYILRKFIFFVLIAEQVISKKNNKIVNIRKITMYILRNFIFFVIIAEQVISFTIIFFFP